MDKEHLCQIWKQHRIRGKQIWMAANLKRGYRQGSSLFNMAIIQWIAERQDNEKP